MGTILENMTAREIRLLLEKHRLEMRFTLAYNEGFAKGFIEGKRGSVLAVLKARGLTPSPAEQEQLAAVTDLDQLDKLLQSAATATTMKEALAPLRSRPARASSKVKKLNGNAR